MLKRLRIFKFKNLKKLFKPFDFYTYITGFPRMTDLQDKRKKMMRRLKLLVYTFVLLVLYSWLFFFYISETFDFNYAFNLHKWW
jgi:hypothetical protein